MLACLFHGAAATSITLNAVFLIALLAVGSWNEHRKCTCRKRSTFLKPQWKKIDRKNWHDD